MELTHVSEPVKAWVSHFREVIIKGKDLVRLRPVPHCAVKPDDKAPRVLIFSPHPDDETITGLLPLRLLLEAHWRVINVPITYGRHVEQRARRKAELFEACARLGFDVHSLTEWGLDWVNEEHRTNMPKEWSFGVEQICKCLADSQPILILFPHSKDFHPAHKGVSLMVKDALHRYRPPTLRWIVETEFWHPIETPNMLVEGTIEHVTLLVQALLAHRGELERNPYHVYLPARLADNVRRGSEVVCGAGAPAVPFLFGELYRVSYYEAGMWRPIQGPMVISASEVIEKVLVDNTPS